MSTYRFDILSDSAATTEIVEAADDKAATRQALLLVSEIVRDHGLSHGDAVAVQLAVKNEAGDIIWTGSAEGGR